MSTSGEKRDALSVSGHVPQGRDDVASAASLDDVCVGSSETTKDKNGVLTKKDERIFDSLKAGYTSIEDISITVADKPLSVTGKSGDATSRLQSIAKVPVADMTNRVRYKFCALAKISGYKGKVRKGLCDLIVAHKINVTTYRRIPNASLDFEIPGQQSSTVKRTNNSFLCIINYLRDPEVKLLYATFQKQPDKQRSQKEKLLIRPCTSSCWSCITTKTSKNSMR